MLITEHYVEQNRLLHAARPDYGACGSRQAHQVTSFMRDFECETLLDYGCGKGSLVEAIPGTVGYDPAVPEFSERPGPADCVACLDVLEHIEPDCLDEVLEDLRTLSRKAVFLIISCRPAIKTLPDGRNAHLIVESPEWWIKRLSAHFDELSWKIGPDFIKYYGRPLAAKRAPKEATIPLYSEHGTPSFARTVRPFVSANESIENIRQSCALGLLEAKVVPSHTRRMAFCAYGPSLNDHLEELRAETGDVVTISGAHDVLIENGITPYAHMEADAQKHKAQFHSLAKPGVRYFIASRCHPDVFANLSGYDVTLWHMNHSTPENVAVKEFYPGAEFIQGSISIAGRGICLALVLGYRDFTIYGMDCSFPYDESKPFEGQPQHAGKHPNPQDVFRTDPIGGRRYYTTLPLIRTAEDFLDIAKLATVCKYEIRGTGLLAAKAKHLNLPHIRTPDL